MLLAIVLLTVVAVEVVDATLECLVASTNHNTVLDCQGLVCLCMTDGRWSSHNTAKAHFRVSHDDVIDHSCLDVRVDQDPKVMSLVEIEVGDASTSVASSIKQISPPTGVTNIASPSIFDLS